MTDEQTELFTEALQALKDLRASFADYPETFDEIAEISRKLGDLREDLLA